MRPRLFGFLGAIALAAWALHGCDGGTTTGTTGTTGTGGAGGAGGSCDPTPRAMFVLTVTADGATVPPDTKVEVSWSAGTEPVFMLDDPHSWKTLDDANLVCDVDPAAPPPKDLAALVCKLWTIGATKVAIEAKGYIPFEQTFVPMVSEHCHGPVPTPIDVKLERAEDGGS